MTRTALAAALILAVAAPAAYASSPDAWAAFHDDVKAKCMAGASDMKSPTIYIHPVGTSSHGIAVLIAGSDKRICVYEKKAKTAELTPAT